MINRIILIFNLLSMIAAGRLKAFINKLEDLITKRFRSDRAASAAPGKRRGSSLFRVKLGVSRIDAGERPLIFPTGRAAGARKVL